MERYDIAIIGTGPAGLEAAVTAKIRNKNILLFGNKSLSNKIEKAHTIKNYLGLPEISGEDLQNSFKKHLEQMEIEITEDKVNAVYSMGNYFAIQGHGGIYEFLTYLISADSYDILYKFFTFQAHIPAADHTQIHQGHRALRR